MKDGIKVIIASGLTIALLTKTAQVAVKKIKEKREEKEIIEE